MQTAATIGLDIAKNVFQVHSIASDGRVVFRQQIKRNRVLKFFGKLEPCVVGIEACATSHHWAREIGALGHTVKLMPPKYVKAYVKRQKNNAADAEAICEAVQRPSMRFVPVKTPDDQAGLVLHRTRHLFVRHLTAVVNALRAHMAEFGIVAAKGREGVAELVAIIKDLKSDRLPEPARACLYALSIQLDALSQQIAILDKRLNGWSRTNETCRRLDVMPGVGPALATALVASIPDPHAFRSGRDFAAWIGLVPKQNSSGGKERLGSITKEGDRYLRSLFCAGALAVIRYAQKHGTNHRPWLTSLLARRPAKVAAIALANKLARMAWAIMAKGEAYREPAALAR